MIDTLTDFLDQLAEPFSTAPTLDWYLQKAITGFQTSKMKLVDALTEQHWLECVLSGNCVPTYSALYEKYKSLEFFDRLTPAGKDALMLAHRQTSDAAHRILREEEDAIQILFLFRECLTTFGDISDPHPPIGYFIQVVRAMLKQNQKLEEQFSLLDQFHLPIDSPDAQTGAARLDSELDVLVGSIDAFEKHMIDFLTILDTRISKTVSAEQRETKSSEGNDPLEEKTAAAKMNTEENAGLEFSFSCRRSAKISEESLRKLLLSMDVVQRLQANQEEERLLWKARANVAKKKDRHELVEAALARSVIHAHKAKVHGECLRRVKQCVQHVRHLPRRT